MILLFLGRAGGSLGSTTAKFQPENEITGLPEGKLQDDQVLKLAVSYFRYSSGIKANNLAVGKNDWESSNSVRDMIVSYFQENSPVEPAVDHNWRITGIDLSEDDPRRAEIIGYINEGLLPTPYEESYNLADYDALVTKARENSKKPKKE